MKKNELKCPLCGGEIFVDTTFIGNIGEPLEKTIRYYYVCKKCECRTEFALTEEEAIENLNKREFWLNDNFIKFLQTHLDYELTANQKETIKSVLQYKIEKIDNEIERLNKDSGILQRSINTVEQYPDKTDMWIYALMATKL